MSSTERKPFNARAVYGFIMAGGGAIGLVIKTYISLDGTPPFWWWAASGVVLFIGLALLIDARRQRNTLRTAVRLHRNRGVAHHESDEDAPIGREPVTFESLEHRDSGSR